MPVCVADKRIEDERVTPPCGPLTAHTTVLLESGQIMPYGGKVVRPAFYSVVCRVHADQDIPAGNVALAPALRVIQKPLYKRATLLIPTIPRDESGRHNHPQGVAHSIGDDLGPKLIGIAPGRLLE